MKSEKSKEQDEFNVEDDLTDSEEYLAAIDEMNKASQAEWDEMAESEKQALIGGFESFVTKHTPKQ